MPKGLQQGLGTKTANSETYGASMTKRRITNESLPLPHLSDHVSVATALDETLDGSALFVVLAMYRAFHLLDRDQITELARWNLTPVQFNILTTLQRVGKPTTIGSLAGMLIVRPNHMSGNIQTLAKRGLINREINPEDSRSVLIELTRDGHIFLNKELPAHWRRLESLLADLDQDQRSQLIELLRALVGSLVSRI